MIQRGLPVMIVKVGNYLRLHEGQMQEYDDEQLSSDVGEVFRYLLCNVGRPRILRLKGGELLRLRDVCKLCGVETLNTYTVSSLLKMPYHHAQNADTALRLKYEAMADVLAHIEAGAEGIPAYLEAVREIDHMAKLAYTTALLRLSGGYSPYGGTS